MQGITLHYTLGHNSSVSPSLLQENLNSTDLAFDFYQHLIFLKTDSAAERMFGPIWWVYTIDKVPQTTYRSLLSKLSKIYQSKLMTLHISRSVLTGSVPPCMLFKTLFILYGNNNNND